MKKIVVILICGILIIVLSSNYNGAPPGYTGAPGESSCVLCHADYQLNAGSATTSITGISEYVPAQNYKITVSINPTQSPSYNGFQLVVLENVSNTNAGTLSVTDNSNTKLVSGGGKDYITFTEAGSQLDSWSFDWTAPSENIGSVSFYAAFNDGDGGGDPGDDFIYTNSLSVNAKTTGNDDVLHELTGFKIYPNPMTGNQLTIDYGLNERNKVQVLMMDEHAKNVIELMSITEGQGFYTHTFALDNYSAGVYFLIVNVAGIRNVYKIIKLNN